MDLPNFLHECRGQQGQLFEQDYFQKKSFITDHRGLVVQKRFFIFFCLYKKTALRRAHCLRTIVFQKKIIIPDYSELIVQEFFEQNCFFGKILNPRLQKTKCPKRYFLLLRTLLQNYSRDLPIFLPDCRRQQGRLFQQD